MVKLVFIHTAKNAGTSIRAIRGFSIISQLSGFRGTQNRRYRDHVSFGVCRNPFDRLLSIFLFHYQRLNPQPNFYPSGKNILLLEDFCKNFNPKTVPRAAHRKTQYDSLTYKGKSVHHLLRFENLNDDWSDFAALYNLNPNLPHKNRTFHNPWQEYYTTKTRDYVLKLFPKDFDFFGYSTEI